MNSPEMPPKPIIPSSLKKGDLLGVVAPAGQLTNEDLFHSGVQILTEMGFEVKFPRELWPGMDYLSDCDDNRANELNAFFRDSDVKGLVSMRGGYGCLRILDKINLDLVTANPKFLIGFSDITVLQNFLYVKTGLVSLHGPTLTSLASSSRETLEKFHSSLTGQWSRTIYDRSIVQLQGSGRISAPLIGGNLASIVTLLGTKFDCPWEDCILFLEDINEPLYKVDRMLTQLSVAGKFDKIKGVLLGNFSQPKDGSSLDELRYKEAIWKRFLEICPNRQIPVWGDFPSGHCNHNITFPLGAMATMDCNHSTLNFK
ncbi:LD-carboxypeptidase [Desulforhopalus sp. IMCC35007]|uniref:S66 peptidase family protein n=1 Tax=Desulforhopalus sp. IMCC35007 TaxID=2569543 RepID=UPI0010AE3E24|nr:LD-carboxypeptidase [Desulforhopalus sp. IMCC35007]TKB11123.1 LD-carboxypeptidase [Desulforhopalus sp. IMCC35007]